MFFARIIIEISIYFIEVFQEYHLDYQKGSYLQTHEPIHLLRLQQQWCFQYFHHLYLLIQNMVHLISHPLDLHFLHPF